MRRAVVVLTLLMSAPRPLLAHEGPPFPIVSTVDAGAYVVSVWTDPDTTDDGTPGGQFWVLANRAGNPAPLPAGTQARVTIAPVDRPGDFQTGVTQPVEGNLSNQFVALRMDHEGRFRVRVAIDGPLGRAELDAEVEGTYDERPPPVLLLVYVVPFVLVGVLWLRLILRRRRLRR